MVSLATRTTFRGGTLSWMAKQMSNLCFSLIAAMRYVMETTKCAVFKYTQRTELIPSEPFYTEYMISDFFCPQVCVQRCLERGKSSGRTDDNRESVEKRYSPAAQTK